MFEVFEYDPKILKEMKLPNADIFSDEEKRKLLLKFDVNNNTVERIEKIFKGKACTFKGKGEWAKKLEQGNFKEIKEIYRRRRDIIVNSLNKIEGVTCSTPKGAIYAFAKLPVESSEDFCKWLLTEFVYDNSTVMLAPGEGFYETEGLGKNEVRFSFCVGEDDIEKAMKVLEEALKVYKK